jgi:hypothetical protein
VKETQNTKNAEMICLIKHFNETTSFDKVKTIESRDASNLAVILKLYGAERIKEAFIRANNSRFLTGQKGFEWKADCGWIVKPDHIESILKGKYDDYKRVSPVFVDVSESSINDELVNAALNRGFDGLL